MILGWGCFVWIASVRVVGCLRFVFALRYCCLQVVVDLPFAVAGLQWVAYL